ncbi:MAG TPA: hypothetical protein PKM58_12560, partial [Pyrinomonadaceae bacterium]|nr:hypothetical protein [Pyrinomonadaceae bacterium]
KKDKRAKSSSKPFGVFRHDSPSSDFPRNNVIVERADLGFHELTPCFLNRLPNSYNLFWTEIQLLQGRKPNLKHKKGPAALG